MLYKKTDMAYKDYRWTAKADNDNPDFRKYQEKSELDRTEGYEMLYFINALAREYKWDQSGSCKALEKAIRQKVPLNIRTHYGIRAWIELHHKEFWSTL